MKLLRAVCFCFLLPATSFANPVIDAIVSGDEKRLQSLIQAGADTTSTVVFMLVKTQILAQPAVIARLLSRAHLATMLENAAKSSKS